MSAKKETRVVAPYITTWSAEVDPAVTLVERHGGGIAYADEVVADRDGNGVLWWRTSLRPGSGRPLFGQVHPLRQRRAMRRLLCQVCAGPADRTDDGVLWLLKDHRDDWPSWPDGMGVMEPPICVSCVALSVRLCPALRRSAAVVRARRFPVAGVRGALYRGGPRPVPIAEATLRIGDPRTRWLRATSLIRELNDTTVMPFDIGGKVG
ncbi:hypothetical protein [Actinophytocola sp. KF-1]